MVVLAEEEVCVVGYVAECQEETTEEALMGAYTAETQVEVPQVEHSVVVCVEEARKVETATGG